MGHLDGFSEDTRKRFRQVLESAHKEYSLQVQKVDQEGRIFGHDIRPFWETEKIRVPVKKREALKCLGTLLFFLLDASSSLELSNDELRFRMNLTLTALRRVILDQMWPKPIPISPYWQELMEQEFDRDLIQWLEGREEWLKHEARVLPQIEDSTAPDDSGKRPPSPLRYFPFWSLNWLSVRARNQIKAGLLEIHGTFLDHKVQAVDCWRLTYDLLAHEFDLAQMLSEDLLERRIPRMVADAVAGSGWSNEPLGRTRPTAIFSEPFGSQFYPLWHQAKFLEELKGRIAHWSGRLALSPPVSTAGGKTRNKAWRFFLSRIAAAELVLTKDDVDVWSTEEFEALVASGLINPIAEAVQIADRETHRWTIDVSCLAVLLADAFELHRGRPPEATASGLWGLGRRRLGGQFRDFFLAVSPEEELAATVEEALKQLSSATGLLIMAGYSNNDAAWKPARLQLIALEEITSWEEAKIVPDFDLIEGIFVPVADDNKKPRVRSLSLPHGVNWPDLVIEVHDSKIRIQAAVYNKELSFEQAGFGERGQRLETLKLLAAGRGWIDAKRASDVRHGKTPLKNRINQLRQHLQILFALEGDPIEYHKRGGIWECKFQVRLAGDASFPTPAGASWLDFQLVERRDGRLAVTVDQQRVFRAHKVESGSGWLNEEVAQQAEPVTRIFSLEDIGLSNRRGQPTPEGAALVELLRGKGKLKRRGDDMAVLKLDERLRKWTGLNDGPLQYSDRNQEWSACFACSIEPQQ